jgi:hypothetical protein
MLLSFLLVFLPSVAQANAGVPMIYLIFPPSLFAILPIIIIEAFVYTRLLRLNLNEGFLFSLCANLVSTLAGFPLLWIAIVGIGFAFSSINLYEVASFILFPVWLGPIPNKQLLYLVPLSAILFLIIAYFASVFVERFIIALLLKKKPPIQPIDNKKLTKCVWIANTFTYVPLTFSVALYLYFLGLQYVT